MISRRQLFAMALALPVATLPYFRPKRRLPSGFDYTIGLDFGRIPYAHVTYITGS